jgi:hypothetical protein
MDIQNNIFAIVSTIVKTISAIECATEETIKYHTKISRLKLDIEHYRSFSESYMESIKALKESKEDYKNFLLPVIVGAWEDKQYDIRYAEQELCDTVESLIRWRESAIRKTVIAMGITEPNIKNMFVELAIKHMTSK